MALVARHFVLLQPFRGEPQKSDFRLEEEKLPNLKKGDVLAEALFLSVDPYMRSYSSLVKPGKTMMGTQVARVTDSKAADWPVGQLFVGDLGWRTHTVFNPQRLEKDAFIPSFKLPDMGELPKSLALGVLGMPGNTAYFGLLDACQPKENETVVVTSAAGAVGSTAGQIAKIKGCRVVGFTGSDEKVRWLKETLGFDAAYNYKMKNFETALKEGAPKGVDIFFDNVGGEISDTISTEMNSGGRWLICGSVSQYNDSSSPAKLSNTTKIKEGVKVKHFSVTSYKNRWMEGIKQNLEWIKEGRLQYRETIWQGFESMPDAFIGMLQGANIGKAVVKI